MSRYSDLHRTKCVIFGAKQGQKGCGLVSTLRELNSNLNDERITLEVFKHKCFLALDGWRKAKPEWNFILVNISGMSLQDFEAIYERSL